MRENSSNEKVIRVGDVQGPEKVNDTCMKTLHAGMLDSGFTVLINMPYFLIVSHLCCFTIVAYLLITGCWYQWLPSAKRSGQSAVACPHT
jgi:hypothetical protein